MKAELPEAERLRRRRLAEFRRRANFAPETVYRHCAHGWEYVPVHPFADEHQVLAGLGITRLSASAQMSGGAPGQIVGSSAA